jgi:hypothetical protein
MSNEVVIHIDLDSLKASFKQAEDDSAESGKKIGKNLGEGAESGSEKYLKGLQNKLLALGSALFAGFSVKKIIDEASQADSALARMNAALNNAGSYSAQASREFEDYANTLQKTMGIEDEAALGLLSLAKSYGVTNDRAKEMVATAINLSAATGMGLDAAMRQLGATLEGNAGRLSKLSKDVGDLGPAALKAGQAIDILNARFSGSAAAQMDSFGGSIKAASLAFEDVMKELGFLVTRSPVVIKAVQFIGQQFQHLGDYLEGFRKGGVDVVGQFLKKILDVSEALSHTLLPVFEVVYNIGRMVFSAITTAVSTLYTDIVGLGALVGKVLSAISPEKFGAFNETMQGMFEAAKQTTDQLAQETVDSAGQIFSTGGSKAAQGFIEGLNTAIGDGTDKLRTSAELGISKVNDEIQQSTSNMNWDAFLKGFRDAALKAQGTMDSLSKNMYQILVTGSSNVFVKMGEAWQNGTDVMTAFGKAVLSMFGDLAIQLGTFYFTLGLANLFLNPAAAAAEIIGGAALLTLGGVLKALGGGGGSSATAVTPSGGVAVNNGANIGGDVTAVQEQRKAEPTTTIHVNVQGNVLDRRQTGLELADAISEAFGANGATFVGGT